MSTKEISRVLDPCEPNKKLTSLLEKLMLELQVIKSLFLVILDPLDEYFGLGLGLQCRESCAQFV